MKNSMYEETPARGEAAPQYRRPRRRRTGRIVTFVILISLLVVLIVGGLGIGLRLLNPIPIRTTTETRTFNLGTGAQPTLTVSADDGFIHVRPGISNAMTVTATKVGDSFAASPDDFKISYSQHGTAVTIQVNNNGIHPFDFLNSSQADLEVTVPINSDLHLQTNSGDISVTGIQGKMTLSTNSGTLQATDVSLNSDSQLSTDLLSELRLLLKGVPWWWFIGAAALIALCLFLPLAVALGYLFPVAWLWSLPTWSALGSQETRHHTEQLVFSTAHPLARQLPIQWLAGVVIALLTASGMIAHFVIMSDWPGLVALGVGAIFVPALALAAGIWTGNSRLFEIVFVAL